MKNSEQQKKYRFSPNEIVAGPEEVARYFGGPKYELTQDTAEKIRDAITRARGLIEPVMVLTVKPVRPTDTRLIFENGDQIDVPRTGGHEGAGFLAVWVCTLGRELDDAIRELSNAGEFYKMLMMDAVGLALLDALSIKCHEVIDAIAEEKKVKAGCRFGPGYGGVPMELQSTVFSHVDASAIDVRLNDSYVMEPVKSLSSFVILGSDGFDKDPGAKCRRCDLKHCQFRVA